MIYAAFGAVWILLSDQILDAVVHDPHVITKLQTTKGWVYVAVTALLIYAIVRHYFTAAEESDRLLEESEARYRAIVETSLDGIALTDAQDRVAFVNARMAEMLGRPPDTLIGRPLADALEDERYTELRRRLTEPAPGRSGRCEIDLWRPDRSEFRGIASVCPRFDDRHAFVGMLVMLTDITEQKRLQDELHQAQKMEAIGQLAGGVAHDFNNLLTAIFGYTDLARRTLTPGHPALASLDGVLAAAEQAAGVSRSLLTFSRKTPIQKQTIGLNEVVTRAARLLRRLLPASIELVTEAAGEEPALVEADGTQMQQVIMNLAINARDAMPAGGVLRIAARPPTEAERDESRAGESTAPAGVCLEVSDTGIGMAPEVLNRIFEPFFTTKPKGVGTGLGLSIIHGIIEEHGGTIRVRSEPGKGTTFTIWLPAPSRARAEAAAAPATSIRGAGEMILIAEDDEQVRSIMTSALRAAGYQVLAVGDGTALLEAFEQNRPHVRLIVTDAEMPRQSGLAAVRRLREEGADVPVVLVTGSVETSIEGQVDERTALLRKPYPMSALLSLISQRLPASPGPRVP
ncbi:MAG: hybrid sensor histidine kinase/response regulator [Phycisphaerae bacterium]